MACSGSKRGKQCLTLNDKLEILKKHDSAAGNLRLNKLAKILKIARSTLVTIINNRESIEKAPVTDRHRYRTRNKRKNPFAGKSKYQALDEALVKWVKGVQEKGERLDGIILRKKARKLASDMGLENFTASNGWSDRFKKKYGIEYKTKSCYCQYKLNDEIPDKTNYGVENFLDKIGEEMQIIQTSEVTKSRNSANNKSKINLIGIRLIQWLDEVRSELNITKISGSLIKEMALSLAGVLGVTNFTASGGWLNRFHKKYHLLKNKKCKNCCGLKKFTTTNSDDDNKLLNESVTMKGDPTQNEGLLNFTIPITHTNNINS